MLLPGFEGRLARLAFVKQSATIAIASGAAKVILAILLASGGSSPRAFETASLLLVSPFALYAGLSVQARRLNDIGWPPLPFIGLLSGAAILNVLLPHLVPSSTLSTGGTSLGSAISGFLILILALWPGRFTEPSEPLSAQRPPVPRSTTRQRPVPGDDILSGTASRANGGSGFGRKIA